MLIYLDLYVVLLTLRFVIYRNVPNPKAQWITEVTGQRPEGQPFVSVCRCVCVCACVSMRAHAVS
jgi:hypothetical protein